jgi:hypothetical protein
MIYLTEFVAIWANTFPNYMFIVMDDDGDLFYDYTNHKVGRMLLRETKEIWKGRICLDIIWEEEEYRRRRRRWR